jgi:peptidyl-prolyl cis-trans isomerase C
MQLRTRERAMMLMLSMSFMLISTSAMALEKGPSDEKMAVVNGTVITRDNFDREMSRVRQRFERGGRPLTRSQLSDVETRVLENLINNTLLYQQTESKGIKVNEQAVLEQMDNLKKQFASEEEFKTVIERMGLSETDIKSQIEEGLSVQKLIDEEFVQGITVTAKETRAYYDDHPDLFKKPEEIRASHILIKVDPEADASQKAASYKKMEEIQMKIQQGEDFAALAKEFSEGPSNVRGGDLGFFKRGQMVKPFEDAAFALEPGGVSAIVETRFGYHIIKVLEKKPETTSDYGEVKDELQKYLKRQEIEKKVQQYVEELKKKAKIERYLNENNSN